ncbi:MAG: sigma-70 family RNA polymerase sigma factor [Planctomycetota bacterium]|nr:MAG: sigma-70 family RNA polymerase sigma factor [Planctomycetota bacterium]
MVSRDKRGRLRNKTLERLWAEYRRGNRIEARDALIEYYRPYASSVVRRVRARLPRSVEPGDLEGAGDVGLIQAIQHYDPARGVPFEAFCEHRVRGAILDELRRHDWLPRPLRNRLNQKRDVLEALRHRLGHDPGDAEIAAELGLSMGDYLALFGNGRDTPLLAAAKPGKNGADDEAGLDFLEDPREEGPLDDAHRRELLERIASTLDAESREILFKRYFEERTLKEIGDDLGISQSRVSKILGRLMDRLNDRFDDRGARS